MIRTDVRLVGIRAAGLTAAVLCAASAAWGGSSGVGGGAPVAFSDRTVQCNMIASHQPSAPLLFSIFNVAPMLGGGAVGDFNRDGFQDVFFVASGGARDRLFINNGNGTFAEQSVAWGVGDTHMGLGAAVGDYNKDGWPDIYVTSVGVGSTPMPGQHRLYRNNGNSTFTNVAAAAGVNNASSLPDGFGSTFGDYDLDGDLDLFVAGWVATSNGNRLFRNNGDGTFTDVTVAAGFTHAPIRGFSPGFVDMNGDRYPELILAADFGTSQYYVNNRNGTFTRWTAQSGTGLDGNGMGSAVGDFNGDGALEWYVTSIRANQPEIGIPGTGNMLYVNQGNHVFTEGSIGTGVNDGGWGWGTIAMDLNHDMLEDIVEINGWPFSNFLGQLEWNNEQAYVWKNNGDMTFTEVAISSGFSHFKQGRGLLRFDLDNDGDQDFVPINYFDTLTVYRNDLNLTTREDTHWLRVFLDTTLNPFLAADGLGAVVKVTAGGVTQVRNVNAMNHYLSTSEVSAHFGLGTNTVIDTIRVEWANGIVTEDYGVTPNLTMTIAAPKPGDADRSGLVGIGDVALVILYWGQNNWQGDVTGDGVVDIADLAMIINYFAT